MALIMVPDSVVSDKVQICHLSWTSWKMSGLYKHLSTIAVSVVFPSVFTEGSKLIVACDVVFLSMQDKGKYLHGLA